MCSEIAFSKNSHHIDPNQLICITNQLTGFTCMSSYWKVFANRLLVLFLICWVKVSLSASASSHKLWLLILLRLSFLSCFKTFPKHHCHRWNYCDFAGKYYEAHNNLWLCLILIQGRYLNVSVSISTYLLEPQTLFRQWPLLKTDVYWSSPLSLTSLS